MNANENQYKQLHDKRSLRVHFVQGKDATAMELHDKETFLKQVFTTDPQKGCELLFRRYYAVLCNHAVRIVYSKELAEDIVSDVFLKFWNKRLYETIESSYRAYLFKAVRNTALNQLKKVFGDLSNESLIDENSTNEAENPFLVFETLELSKQLEKTIQLLSPKCQTVFLMSRLEGKKNHEIAKKLSISIKAVEAHISKALAEIRQTLQHLNK